MESKKFQKSTGLELYKKKRWSALAFVFLLAILLDNLFKRYAHNIFYNRAFAFSLPVPSVLIYLIYFIVVVGMIYYVLKNHHQFSFASKVAWTLIFAGAASNIGERILLGYVRDFIYISFYKWTGVYNAADGYIIAGIILLLFSSTKIIDKN